MAVKYTEEQLNNVDKSFLICLLLQQRQMVIKPLVDAFFAYIKKLNVSKKDKFGEAVHYALNQKLYLRVFLTDGEAPMDNNASERAIRGFCIGKKN